VASAYDLAERVLASQRKFAEDVVKATRPLMPGSAVSQPEDHREPAQPEPVAAKAPATAATKTTASKTTAKTTAAARTPKTTAAPRPPKSTAASRVAGTPKTTTSTAKRTPRNSNAG
jgi:hypothetical protein